MRLSVVVFALLAAIASACPIERRQGLGNLLGAGDDPATQDAIDQLTQTFDRNNPNGTPVGPGNEDDLNGDGVINAFEAGAQASRRSPQNNIIQQLQDTFDRDNPNGTPVDPGNEDDLNGDGVINAFEAGAQVS